MINLPGEVCVIENMFDLSQGLRYKKIKNVRIVNLQYVLVISSLMKINSFFVTRIFDAELI